MWVLVRVQAMMRIFWQRALTGWHHVPAQQVSLCWHAQKRVWFLVLSLSNSLFSNFHLFNTLIFYFSTRLNFVMKCLPYICIVWRTLNYRPSWWRNSTESARTHSCTEKGQVPEIPTDQASILRMRAGCPEIGNLKARPHCGHTFEEQAPHCCASVVW